MFFEPSQDRAAKTEKGRVARGFFASTRRTVTEVHMPFSGSQRPQAGLVRKSILSPRSSKALWPASIACSLLAGVLMASSACSTESGGRKTPLAGSPAPTVPPAGRPAAGDSRGDATGDATGDAAQTQALEAARRAAVLSQSPPRRGSRDRTGRANKTGGACR